MESAGESRNVPIKVLRSKTNILICDLLNPQMFISAPNGTLRYWKGLADLCDIGSNYGASLTDDPNPTAKVLSLWYEKDPDSCTIQQFLLFLEEMDRYDVLADIIDLIDEDIEVYKTNPQVPGVKALSLEADKYLITTDDVKRINNKLAPENYDAFLLYDQDDIDFAIQLLETMEKDYNMKFCVKDRDLLGGGLEMDKIITLITERCNRLVVILSDSFFKSSSNDYYLKFANAYGIEKQRKIIPCVYKDLSTYPSDMKYLFTLDYRRTAIFNFWDKLRDTIIVADPEKVKIIRSRSDNGQTLRSAIHENDGFRLKPLSQSVKFSNSVGAVDNLESIDKTPLNPSTSADNLGVYPENNKKKKKPKWLQKITGHLKKEKPTDCVKAEREKTKVFRKHHKRATAVAN